MATIESYDATLPLVDDCDPREYWSSTSGLDNSRIDNHNIDSNLHRCYDEPVRREETIAPHHTSGYFMGACESLLTATLQKNQNAEASIASSLKESSYASPAVPVLASTKRPASDMSRSNASLGFGTYPGVYSTYRLAGSEKAATRRKRVCSSIADHKVSTLNMLRT